MDPQSVIYADPFVASPVTFSPGLELSLCQRVVLRMGGNLMFYESPDNRNVSRFLIPLAEAVKKSS
jgi:hypothetical protein